MKLWCALVVVLGVVVAGCGPSTQQVESARAARYKAPVETIFSIAQDAAKASFKIGEVDEQRGAFMTLPKWYSPDGQSESAGVGDAVQVEDGSMLVALLVEVVPADTGVVTVRVTPVAERFRMGQSQHDRLKPDDPSMPGWVTGKAEALLVAIHDRAKQYVAP